MKSFFLGLGVGTAVGLLIAPQEGSKTRQNWIELARDWFGESSEKRNLEQTRVEVDEEAEEVTDVLNTAKRDELLSVPGIGKATAKRIIKHRPYQSEEEVLEEGVLPELVWRTLDEDIGMQL